MDVLMTSMKVDYVPTISMKAKLQMRPVPAKCFPSKTVKKVAFDGNNQMAYGVNSSRTVRRTSATDTNPRAALKRASRFNWKASRSLRLVSHGELPIPVPGSVLLLSQLMRNESTLSPRLGSQHLARTQ